MNKPKDTCNPLLFCPKALGKSPARERDHDGNNDRLVSAFDCRLNVTGSNLLGYTFNLSFWVLSQKVLWTSGKLQASASATTRTITIFSKESKYLKQPENFFQGILVQKFIQGFSKYALSDPSIFPRIQGMVDTLVNH